MSEIIAIEPAIDPGARPTFLIDWELTLKCNLDCSYCASGPDGSHWNASKHPPLDECISTIDFMLEYADLYMQQKPRWSRAVVLNVYGGEALYHPDIEQILEQIHTRYKKYSDRWPMKITCTTNAVVKTERFQLLSNLIDEFTVSYHTETNTKQKQQIMDNIQYLHDANRDVKVIVLMHSNHSLWPELLELIDFCKLNNIRHLIKQLDGTRESNYNSEQIQWLKQIYNESTPGKSKAAQKKLLDDAPDKQSMNQVGRACCGGRLMCANQDLKHPLYFVPQNNFLGWNCSVNWFFVYIKQYSKQIYTNKDCQMTFDQNVGPIGNLDNTKKLLEWTSTNLKNNTLPVIQCAKTKCVCGICSPKALTKSDYDSIMKKHITQSATDK